MIYNHLIIHFKWTTKYTISFATFKIFFQNFLIQFLFFLFSLFYGGPYIFKIMEKRVHIHTYLFMFSINNTPTLFFCLSCVFKKTTFHENYRWMDKEGLQLHQLYSTKRIRLKKGWRKVHNLTRIARKDLYCPVFSLIKLYVKSFRELALLCQHNQWGKFLVWSQMFNINLIPK